MALNNNLCETWNICVTIFKKKREIFTYVKEDKDRKSSYTQQKLTERQWQPRGAVSNYPYLSSNCQ